MNTKKLPCFAALGVGVILLNIFLYWLLFSSESTPLMLIGLVGALAVVFIVVSVDSLRRLKPKTAEAKKTNPETAVFVPPAEQSRPRVMVSGDVYRRESLMLDEFSTTQLAEVMAPIVAEILRTQNASPAQPTPPPQTAPPTEETTPAVPEKKAAPLIRHGRRE